MEMIYVFPTFVGVVGAALVVVMARRGGHGLLASALAGAAAGAGAWHVTLFTIVVIMLPMG